MVCSECWEALSIYNQGRSLVANWEAILANEVGHPVFEASRRKKDRLVAFWQTRGWTSSILVRCPCNAYGRALYESEVEVWAAYFHPDIPVSAVRTRVAGPLFPGPADADFWAARNRSSLVPVSNADGGAGAR